jgi:hypothetical protein
MVSCAQDLNKLDPEAAMWDWRRGIEVKVLEHATSKGKR